MGYTHYVNRSNGQDFDQERWNNYIKQCKLIYDNHKLAKKHPTSHDFAINDEHDKSPIFNSDEILFNGCNPPRNESYPVREYNLSYETFFISRKYKDFEFCKTAQKPYDWMVTICLQLLKMYFPKEVTIESDGGDEVFKHDAKSAIDEIMNELYIQITSTGKRDPWKQIKEVQNDT